MASRTRIHYCKLIVLTSVVWFLVDVLLLLYFTDCLSSSEKCMRRQSSSLSGSGNAATGVAPQGFFGRLLPGGKC
jgi:hypothetical protein